MPAISFRIIDSPLIVKERIKQDLSAIIASLSCVFLALALVSAGSLHLEVNHPGGEFQACLLRLEEIHGRTKV